MLKSLILNQATSKQQLSSSHPKPPYKMNSKIVTPDFRNETKFEETFHVIIDNINSGKLYNPGENLRETMQWLKNVGLYNVPHGKQIRGRMVESAYMAISQNPTKKSLELARVLGWCVQMLQASFLIADDIMDNGLTRRGQPCWHRVHNLGNIALNDSMLLEHTAYEVLRIYFVNSEVYTDILDKFQNVAFKTMLGQSLDTRMSQQRNLNKFSLDLYNSIAVHKTSYYTFYLPLVLAMTLAEISSGCPANQQLCKQVEEMCKKIGTLFQIQDDYIDCFTDSNVLGKVGTDIQEGKCTCAKSKCFAAQFKQLKENYGSDDVEKVAAIKQLYNTLELSAVYEDTLKELGDDVVKSIETIEHSGLKTVLLGTVNKILNRKF